MTFSPDSKLIAAGTKDGTIRIIDVAKRKDVVSFDEVQEQILSVAFHPTENLLAATGKDKTIRFWDLKTKKLISTVKPPELVFYQRLIFSAEGKQLGTFKSKGGESITIWSVHVGK